MSGMFVIGVIANYMWLNSSKISVDICALLRYYAASNGKPSPTFWDSVLVPSSGVKKSKKKRNVGKGLPFDTA
jgi:hypothetical protein